MAVIIEPCQSLSCWSVMLHVVPEFMWVVSISIFHDICPYSPLSLKPWIFQAHCQASLFEEVLGEGWSCCSDFWLTGFLSSRKAQTGCLSQARQTSKSLGAAPMGDIPCGLYQCKPQVPSPLPPPPPRPCKYPTTAQHMWAPQLTLSPLAAVPLSTMGCVILPYPGLSYTGHLTAILGTWAVRQSQFKLD